MYAHVAEKLVSSTKLTTLNICLFGSPPFMGIYPGSASYGSWSGPRCPSPLSYTILSCTESMLGRASASVPSRPVETPHLLGPITPGSYAPFPASHRSCRVRYPGLHGLLS